MRYTFGKRYASVLPAAKHSGLGARLLFGTGADAPYLPEHDTTWFKIRNRSYSQWAGWEELFERERKAVPDEIGWDACAKAASSGS